MSDPYLIAHKVRGEAAFDIACQMICPECNGHGDLNIADATFIDCTECEGLGYWWIIPTSGHRAYPYWSAPLDIGKPFTHIFGPDHVHVVFDADMPPSLPDHYPPRVEPKSPKRSLLAELGLAKPQGHPAIVGKLTRRI